MDAPAAPRRSLDRWGFEGERFEVPPPLAAWLAQRLGESEPGAPAGRAAPPLGRPLPELPAATSIDPADRLAHSRGRGLTDLIRLRTGTVPALPDAVVRPADHGQLADLLNACARHGVRVVPWGGGTSVTGGVNPRPDGRPLVTVDLEQLSGLLDLDLEAGLARFAAGTPGPAVERPLARRGLTLGHFPQSWELSTVGGWVATRASGQESLRYGGIERLLAGVELIAPGGRLRLAAQPATATGPDLRQLVLGSEGRLGVIASATLRVSPLPERHEVRAALMPGWPEGLLAVRELVRERLPLSLLRLSDGPETAAALAVGLAGRRLAAALLDRLRARRGGGSLLLYGAAGDRRRVAGALARCRTVLRRHRGLPLGAGPGRRWLADRFRHPYLRDALLDRGVAVDTLETAAPWSGLEPLAEAVRGALESAAARAGERCVVMTHVSHPYPDGASLYFSFFFRCPVDPDAACARWAQLKRAATAALLAAGGTLSHHHGIGSWHAPWLAAEIGETGMGLLERVAGAMDPDGILAPGVLLDPSDRLEE